MPRRLHIQVAIGITVLVFSGGTALAGGRVDPTVLRFFGLAVFLSVLVFGSWERYLWRLPPVQRLQSVPPDLNGTWKGTLTSLWVNPDTDERLPPKDMFLVIRQTASRIHVVLLTDESRSSSFVADLTMTDTIELHYLFTNSPAPQHEDRSRMHRGAVSLVVSGRPAQKLEGRYWTDRGTRGEMSLQEHRSRAVDDFELAEQLFRSVG